MTQGADQRFVGMPDLNVVGNTVQRTAPAPSAVAPTPPPPSRDSAAANTAIDWTKNIQLSSMGETVPTTLRIAVRNPSLFSEQEFKLPAENRATLILSKMKEDVLNLDLLPRATERTLGQFRAPTESVAVDNTANLTLIKKHDSNAIIDPDTGQVVTTRVAFAKLSGDEQNGMQGKVIFRDPEKAKGFAGALENMPPEAWATLALGVGNLALGFASFFMQYEAREEMLKMQMRENEKTREHETNLLQMRLDGSGGRGGGTSGGTGVQRTVGTTFR